jgi:hypothetical protein|tara:strand:+ start:2836 stop:3033 length:198 start_codon:yes stop_codon:yes gene_type:complete
MSSKHSAHIPKSKIRPLQNGKFLIQVGEYIGSVSSAERVQTKIDQLMSYWTLKNNLSDIDQRSEV